MGLCWTPVGAKVSFWIKIWTLLCICVCLFAILVNWPFQKRIPTYQNERKRCYVIKCNITSGFWQLKWCILTETTNCRAVYVNSCISVFFNSFQICYHLSVGALLHMCVFRFLNIFLFSQPSHFVFPINELKEKKTFDNGLDLLFSFMISHEIRGINFLSVSENKAFLTTKCSNIMFAFHVSAVKSSSPIKFFANDTIQLSAWPAWKTLKTRREMLFEIWPYKLASFLK